MQVSSVVAICGLFYGKYYLNCHLSSFNFSPEGWCFLSVVKWKYTCVVYVFLLVDSLTRLHKRDQRKTFTLIDCTLRRYFHVKVKVIWLKNLWFTWLCCTEHLFPLRNINGSSIRRFRCELYMSIEGVGKWLKINNNRTRMNLERVDEQT